MTRPRLAVAAAVLGRLCALAAGHGRRAQAWSAAAGHIWGTCGPHWSAKEEPGVANTTCPLVDGWTCADQLSAGPADADIEVTLGNLPPSTSEEDVHLQWWATYKSAYRYDPLSGPGGSAVYGDMGTAYPKYWSAGFNGGNVRVDESGAAVVRVRSPSTYFVPPYIGYPHVHFRVCQGNASAQFYYDSLLIKRGGLQMYTRSQDTAITILSQRSYSGTGVQVDDYDIPDPMGFLVVTYPTTSSSALAVTTTSTSTSTTNAQQWLAVVLDAAAEELLLDALEFSPVYECLSDQNVFDHFSGECADECPGHADLHAGQCVLPKQEGDAVSLTASWQLEVRCEDLCGKSMEKETLHNIRLSVASHLDIPFQEVEEVALIWPTTDQRRLNGGMQVVLSVKVSTERYDLDVGVTSLGAFLDNLGHASQLLGMDVAGATLLANDPEGGADGSDGGSTWTITSDSDPFEVAYDALNPRGDSDADAQATDEILANPLIIAAVVGALVCGGVFGILVWKLRQWRLGKLPENEPELDPEWRPPVVPGMPVEDSVDAKTADLDCDAKSEPKLAWS